jgi:hypothetical protein
VSRIVRVVGVCLLAALALSACGGGGSTSGPQRDLIKKADAICLDTQDKVGRTLGDDAAADRDAVHSASNRLMALDAPSEDESTWMVFVQEVNNLWIELEDVAQSLDPSTNDRARADRARARVRQTNDHIKQLAKQYGMVNCAMGFGQ